MNKLSILAFTLLFAPLCASSSTTATTTRTIAAFTAQSRVIQLGCFDRQNTSLLEHSLHKIALLLLDYEIANDKLQSLLAKRSTNTSFDQLNTVLLTLPSELCISIINRIMIQIIINKDIDAQSMLNAVYDHVVNPCLNLPNTYKDQFLDIIKIITPTSQSCLKHVIGHNLMVKAIQFKDNDLIKCLLSLHLYTPQHFLHYIIACFKMNNTESVKILIQHLRLIRPPQMQELINQAFFIAAAKCNINVLQFILDIEETENNTTQINIIDSKNVNALNYVLGSKLSPPQNDITNTAQWLIDKGINIHQGFSLHQAAIKGNIKICETLIQRGFKINALNESNASALIMAAFHRQEAAALWLVENGADITLVESNLQTALHHACFNHLNTLAKELIKRSDSKALEAKSIYNLTPLLVAFSSSNLEIARLLIERGTNTQAIGKLKNNILLILIRNGISELQKNQVSRDTYTACLDLALQYITDINTQNIDGDTALHLAYKTQLSRDLVVPILLQRGADTTITNLADQTPEQMPLNT